MDVLDFVAKWTASGAAERANKDSFVNDLCDALGVPRPNPTTGDPEKDDYVFEADAIAMHEGGRTTIRKIDLLKKGALILEAKQGSDEGSAKLGTAKRGTPLWANAMQSAYGQALAYARTLEEPPPFLITCDIGYCFDVYACFDGTGDYRRFPNPTQWRWFLQDFEKHAENLRTIFTNPLSLDPSRYSAKVTREIAAHLAELAKGLEEAGHPQEKVAKFLMRCLFTMFAEDVGLLKEQAFAKILEKEWIADPKKFKPQVETLWRIMNKGGEDMQLGRVLRFNGGLFAEPEALALTKDQLKTLHAAARCRWEDVEPAIFGTLLERALDPKERHRLGAHYTPRAYVERLVKPTIEEPLRGDWDVVQAEARQLVEQGKVGEAQKVARAFHEKLCHVRVLDPACGTGNFLYVTLDVFKRIEGEVNELLHDLGSQESLATTRLTVTPEQFLGIEVKPWAREIAELVLWIGYLQWEFRIRGKASVPEEPILRDYGNIECRDAVLAWDSIEPVIGEDGKPVTRWDGETMKRHPATGEEVPDDSARVPVVRYVNPRRAEWPRADFIAGNPPYIGNKRMRLALGDGYVEALRAAHDGVPETSDLVMYWWNQAAKLVQDGKARRFGLITTNSITQTFNRKVVERHLSGEPPLSIVFAIPDHPWVDSSDGAAVRVAMTVASSGLCAGRLLLVEGEIASADEGRGVLLRAETGRIHGDLTIGAAVAACHRLVGNGGLSFQGPIPVGDGFRLEDADLARLRVDPSRLPDVVRPYSIGRDLMQVPCRRYIIDFYGLGQGDAAKMYPELMEHVVVHVKPHRDSNPDDRFREHWWVWGRPRPEMRTALQGLDRFIATCRTARHRVFQFLSGATVPDTKIIAIAADDAFALGCLSSRIHCIFARRSGGFLGVGNDATYNHSACFDPFPFPDPTPVQRSRIRDLGEAVDAHRKRQQSLHPDLTITGMYNVLEKLRSGEALTAKEKAIHEHGLVSTLQKIHDDLDAAVFDAYGWPKDLTDEQILERLVELNGVRADEERRGLIRWLRPEYQAPKEAVAVQAALDVEVEEEVAPKGKRGDRVAGKMPALPGPALPGPALPWPATLAERIASVRDLVVRSPRAWTSEDVAKSFKRARRADVESVLDSLAALGLLLSYDLPDGRRWRTPSRTAA